MCISLEILDTSASNSPTQPSKVQILLGTHQLSGILHWDYDKREIGKALLNIKTLKGKQHKPQFTRSLKVYETMRYSLQLTHFLCIGLHMGQES